MTTIPASADVSVTPGVLAAGGSALDLNGLFLTNSTRPPLGSFQTFPTAALVGAYFGLASVEKAFADIYFAGFDNSNRKPGAMSFAQFNPASVSAYVRGGNVSGLTLAQLQAFSGTLSVTIDGVLKTGSVNLAGATSFTNAAEIIGNTLGIQGTVAGTVTGSIATTTFTAASGLTGVISPGDVLSGTGITAGTYILAQLTGPVGGLGTYTIFPSQTAGSTSVTFSNPGVSYDSVLGAFSIFSGTTGASSTITYGSGIMATDLALTQALGAVLSQGAIAAVPAAFMTALSTNFQNWATFQLTFNPDNSGNDIRFAFAQWTSLQNLRYEFVCTDSDVSPTVTVPAASSLGQRIKGAALSGTALNWQPSEQYLGAFDAGVAASIDFTERGGRATFKFRSLGGLTPGVTDQTTANNLDANGYNYYSAVGAANQNFIYYRQGSVSGTFIWQDSYINQIWLNNAFQLALLVLLTNVRSIPYNNAGKAVIEQALADTIQQGLDFGAFRAGVTLSGTQRAAVNAAAGFDIASTLEIQGWYLLIGNATPEVRQARGTPPCKFYYVDGEAVQQINLASVDLL